MNMLRKKLQKYNKQEIKMILILIQCKFNPERHFKKERPTNLIKDSLNIKGRLNKETLYKLILKIELEEKKL